MVRFPSSTRDFLEIFFDNLVRVSVVLIPYVGVYVSVGLNPFELLLLLKFGFFASSLLHSF